MPIKEQLSRLARPDQASQAKSTSFQYMHTVFLSKGELKNNHTLHCQPETVCSYQSGEKQTKNHSKDIEGKDAGK